MLRHTHRRTSTKATTPRKPRFLPAIQALEERLAPVVGAYAIPPQELGFDGVVRMNCTGSLLPSGRHILTAAHCLTDANGNINVANVMVNFDLRDPSAPNGLRTRTITVPQADYRIYPDWNGNVGAGNDIALLLLPELAPSGPGDMGADRYDIYRTSDEVGKIFLFVGYGATGTGASGHDGSFGTKRIGLNRVDALSAWTGGPANDTAWAYDFDDLNGGGDALCFLYDVCDAGLGNAEANTAPGDSGGPSFIDGRIAGVTSYGTVGNASFGDISQHARVSSFAGWIDSYLGAGHYLVVDMNSQYHGNDGQPDTIELRRVGSETIELWINGQFAHSGSNSLINGITIRGSADDEVIRVPANLGVDTIIDGRNGDDQLVVRNAKPATAISVTGNQVFIGNPNFDITFSGVQRLEVRGGMEDSVDVYSTAAGTPLTVNGVGIVNVGMGTGDNIKGPVNVINPPSRTALTVNDSLATSLKSVVLTEDSVSGLTDALVTFTENDLSSLTLNAGPFGDIFAIRSTPKNAIDSLVTTVNAGQGNDTVYVDETGKLDGIQGRLTLNGDAGLDELYFLDYATETPQTYTVVANQTKRSGIAPITHFSFGEYTLKTGKNYDTITVSGSNASGTSINSGDGWDNITILRHFFGNTLTVDAGAGFDTINVGRTSLFGISGTLDLNGGGGGLDTLKVNDLTGVTGKTYSVTHDSLSVANIEIDFEGMQEVTVNASPKDDLINVHSKDAATRLILNGLGGVDTINIGFDNLNGILGTIDVDGGSGTDALNVNDFTGTAVKQYRVYANQLIVEGPDGPLFFTANHYGVESLTINGGNEGDGFYVYGSTAATSLNLLGGGGLDGFVLGEGVSLDGIDGLIRLNGEADGGSALISDSIGTGGRVFTWTGFTTTWDATVVESANLEIIYLYGGQGDDAFHILGTAPNFIQVSGNDGDDTIYGPNVPSAWKAEEDDVYSLNSNVTFGQMEQWVGDDADDTFVLPNFYVGVSSIDGGAGVNTLDYEAATQDVYVNLRTGIATGISGSTSNIDDVLGGVGNDILVGNGGNVLNGGNGRDLLIAGSSASTLIGGNGDDILIAGTTDYDSDQDASLYAIRDYWAGADDYDTRVGNLIGGNGVPALNSTTITNNSSSDGQDVLTGGADRDVFFGDFPSDITDWVEGEEYKFSV